MKKIPTLFKRIYHNASHLTTTDELSPGLEWVLEGRGVATVKYDGTCCAVKSGRFYRRYDAKKGKVPPAGAIPCCAPDQVTGHWPHWLECDFTNTADNWHLAALYNAGGFNLKDGTYEAIGPHFQKKSLWPHSRHSRPPRRGRNSRLSAHLHRVARLSLFSQHRGHSVLAKRRAHVQN